MGVLAGCSAAAGILAADIGAANTRLLIARLASGQAVPVARCDARSGNAVQLKARIHEFVTAARATAKLELLAAALGLPGKVSADRRSCAISYLDPGTFVPFTDLFAELGIAQWTLLNDLECGTLGLNGLSHPQLRQVGGTERQPAAQPPPRVLIMPGSGLGFGLALAGPQPHPSEAGGILAALDLADPAESAIASRLGRLRQGQDSESALLTYETLVRGPAIPEICLALAELEAPSELPLLSPWLAATPPQDRPRLVARWAAGNEPTPPAVVACARRCFSYYGRFLGRAAQSVVLAILPRALYLGGAIARSNWPLFGKTFAAAFHRHPVHGAYLRQLPVYLVFAPDLNLSGAIRKAALLAEPL